MKAKNIYLAGGFKSGWQEIVKEACPQLTYFDPSLHNIKEPIKYTEIDLKGIHDCDIIFAFMENSNPAGYALALEVGYAKALGKITLFIEDELDEPKKRYFDMVRYACDYRFQSLDQAIEFLKTF